jgi:hypothetical protein
LYQRRPSGVTLKCISTHEGQELLRDIHADECGNLSSAGTLIGKAFRSSFYWPSALLDAARMVKRCEECQEDPLASAGAADHPAHLAIRYLGDGHLGSIPSSARGLSLPLRHNQQVHQVGGGGTGAHNFS